MSGACFCGTWMLSSVFTLILILIVICFDLLFACPAPCLLLSCYRQGYYQCSEPHLLAHAGVVTVCEGRKTKGAPQQSNLMSL